MTHTISIDVPSQTLTLHDETGDVLMQTQVSTAKNGMGEQMGSNCTPRGEHVIRAKVGAAQPLNTVFVARRPTGETYSPELRALYPQRDWILTRILWLSGLEPGKNRLGNVDTMRRHIYIHGAPDEDPMGIPGSHGCIKMRTQEVIELFDRVPPGTPVTILG
ncbi:MAG: L,D-transpeptidase [Gammaproteobacteria bacterium]|nr:L,D-transpeptidase [Pseudomonadota bacterium]MCZ6733576.1 L,D-transpeptidase [Gammaproteobacteria bacterium]